MNSKYDSDPTCKFCESFLEQHNGIWLDENNNPLCGGDEYGFNMNKPHAIERD